MIKTTARQIEISMPSLAALGNSKLPAKAAYAVSKLSTACSKELDQYFKQREKIFSDAGCVVKDGKYVHDDQAVVDKAIKDVDEIASMVVEINALMLDIEQFGTAEVPGNAFFGLEWAMKSDT